METEIIQTDNPNIVIERTITEKEIDVEGLANERDGYVIILDGYNKQLDELNSRTIPSFLREMVEREKQRIIGEKAGFELAIQKIDDILTKI